MNAPKNKTVIVGVGEHCVSSDPQGFLVTHALGSCVGVVLYDRKARLGGMLHFMLPDSRLNPDKAASKPAMFGDTGILLLLEQLFAMGAKRKDLEVRLVGGSSNFQEGSVFDIGDRNVLMARKVLWRNNLAALSERVGGSESRTVWLGMEDGRVTVKDVTGEHEI